MKAGAALEGVRVLEVTMYVFGPAAGAVLADWGADVVRVEHPDGDPMRTTASWGYPSSMMGVNYLWELSNRNKRAIAVDLASAEGREVVLSLAERSDVFLTSILPAARRKLGIDVGNVMARNPRIVYARASGVGPRGPECEAGGFDGITYWARSGAAASVTPPDSPYALAMPGPGFGDGQSGMMLAGGIAAALYRRERTGEGVVVDASLLATGLWAMQPGIASTSVSGRDVLPQQRHDDAQNPIVNQYRTSDGRYVSLAMLQADRYWAGFCAAVGREEWVADPRFVDTPARATNNKELIALLDELFAQRTLADWIAVLSGQDGQWDVIRIPGEVKHDRQAVANGYVQQVQQGDVGIHLIAAPVQFDETAPVLRPAPRTGQHTDEVLRENGFADDDIARFRARGAIA